MKNHKIKKGLFIFLLTVLFVPNIQKHLEIFETKPLSGVFSVTEKPEVVRENWISGRYQMQFDNHFRESVGFKETFVRLFGQVRFSLFHKGRGNTVLGNNNILFDTRYIKASLGDDFIGEELLRDKVRDIAFVKGKMEEEGKNLLIVLAPNKARYFKDEIPSNFDELGETNYDVFIKEFKKQKIDYLDFNEYFIENKENGDFSFFPKYGTHWSLFGASFAADSIINYCNSKYHYNLASLRLDSVEKSFTPRDLDYDLGQNLNLLHDMTDVSYSYPYMSVVKNNKPTKKNLLVIADSFYGAIHRSDYWHDVFNMTGYWHYNASVRFKGRRSRKKTPKELEETFPQTDIAVILLTEINLNRIGFGIIDELKTYYSEGKDLTLEKNITYYLNRIGGDPKWMLSIENKAKNIGVSQDSILLSAAKKWATKKTNKEHLIKSKLANQIQIIKNNEVWLNRIKNKAEKESVSLESMIIRTAKFVLKNKE
jgi:hypothetical protein